MNFEINKSNVLELWAMYEDYVISFKKQNYSDATLLCFEDWVNNNVYKCEQCENYFRELEIAEDSEEQFGLDCLCQDCYDSMLEDMR